MKQRILLLFLICLLLTGCGASPPSGGEREVKKQHIPPVQKEISSSHITLRSTGAFPGNIVIDRTKSKKVGEEYHLPVFLSNTNLSDMLDTVTLTLHLPESIRLVRVIASGGHTAQIEGIATRSPVLYYHPLFTISDTYSPLVSSESPLMTLVLSEEPVTETLSFEGSFFQTNATLQRTNEGTLSFEKK